MAKIRENCTNGKQSAEVIIGMALSSCLTEEQLNKTTEEWNKNGGYKTIPWWKWCLDNIEVTLK